MRILLLVAIAAGLSHAGVIQGVAVENASSVPLARTRIKLQRVGGSSGLTPVSNLIAGPMGQFVFTGLSEGLYVVSAVRPAYAETVYVGKPGDSRTSLVRVGRDSDPFAEVRVRRLGVITGRIVDENRVGIPGVNVLAYSASIPLRVVAQGKTDDRGVYRVFGLPKGKYYVRNAPQQLDDGPGLLPTFFPHGTMAKDAVMVGVDLDRETTDVDIVPMHGTLFTLSGTVTCTQGMANVVLTSDTGRRETRVPCGGAFSFRDLAPGEFELLGFQPEERVSSWITLAADRDREIKLQ
ncbi:MAG TPA: carboxypeptidase-like regulatory domain-containing protein, partial [Bryobacteraceae bacterium]|nr:carboxypeptidase-like regulatory domain-containing protein [Bryobacteraceae bacterium]